MRQQNPEHQVGFTLVELLMVIVIIVILAAIAIPSLLAYRRSANEGSAVATLRTIHGAEMTYQSLDKDSNFAGSLSVLANQKLIDSTLGSGLKSGYNFTGGKTDSSSDGPSTLYYSAVPTKAEGVGRTGSRRFGIATDGVIRVSETSIGTHFADVEDVMSGTPFSNN